MVDTHKIICYYGYCQEEVYMMRKQFTTTIDTNISDKFKKTCDSYNLKMNVVLESFMQQFSDQEFKVEIGKSGIRLRLEN